MKTIGVDNISLYDSDGYLSRAGLLFSLGCPIVFRHFTSSKTDEQRQELSEWLLKWKAAGYPNPETFVP